MQDVTIENIGGRNIKFIIFLTDYYKRNREKNLYNDAIQSFVIVLFLCFITNTFAHNKKFTFLQQIDSISIKKQDSLNSLTYFEIQKLRAYSIENADIKDENEYLDKIHVFTKDSLQILAVKLVSIEVLNTKKLLDKDISKNKDFYIALLKDLKESDMDPKEYLFLENKLSKFLATEFETKYFYSKWLNVILGISLIGLFSFLLKSKAKEKPAFSLSKQETNVKKMIIEGKSNKEIAEELFISLSTVKTHVTSVYKKLNVSNRSDLIFKFKNSPGTST